MTDQQTTKAKRAFLSLAVLALLALVLQSLVFSGASFTAGSSNLGNVFTAGNLSHTNSKNGQVVLNSANLRPGQSQNGTLTITGGGDVNGICTLAKASLVDTPVSPGLSTVLTLRVEDVTGTATTLYNGTVAAFATASMGTIAPGAIRSYRFTLTFPTASANSNLQGGSTQLGLQITGASS